MRALILLLVACGPIGDVPDASDLDADCSCSRLIGNDMGEVEVYHPNGFVAVAFHNGATGADFTHDGTDLIYHSGGLVDAPGHPQHDVLGFAIADREISNVYFETAGTPRVELSYLGDWTPFDDHEDGRTMSSYSGMYSLGSATSWWGDLWLAGTLHLAGQTVMLGAPNSGGQGVRCLVVPN